MQETGGKRRGKGREGGKEKGEREGKRETRHTNPNLLPAHCFVGPYVFILHVMFYLNVGYDNDDV